MVRESKGRPEEVWEVVSPWLWFPATPARDIDYAALGLAPPVGIYLSKDFQVSVFDEPGPGNGWPGMWHLSIKRRDRQPLDQDRWRTLQIIKNTLVGSEHEAVELYPAESRLVDTANQWHLFVLKDARIRFPFGFQTRLVTGSSGHGAVQRPFSPGPNAPTKEDEARFATVLEGAQTGTHKA